MRCGIGHALAVFAFDGSKDFLEKAVPMLFERGADALDLDEIGSDTKDVRPLGEVGHHA